MLYPFNYENKCRIFGLFSLFSGYGDLLYNSYQLLDELPFFLPLWFFLASAFFTSEQKPFFCFGFCYIQNLGGACYIHLTTRTFVYYKQILPCIQMFPLKRLPTIGSPMRSFSFIHTLNIISLHIFILRIIIL